MKKFLISLLICFCVDAHVSDIGVVQNLCKELASEKSKNSDGLQKVLDKYLNDGCKVTIGNEEVVLAREGFEQYAKIGAVFFTKKAYKLEFLKDISNENLNKEQRKDTLNVSLKISEKQKIEVVFTLENKKISEVNCKNIQLNLKQQIMLKGIFNLIRRI